MSGTLNTESNHMNPLKELLVEELRDLLHAEGQLVAALPKMAEAAHHPKLKEAFLKHLKQTEGHVERLKNAFELLGEKAQPRPCKAMLALVEEGKETIEEGKEKTEIAADLGLMVRNATPGHPTPYGHGAGVAAASDVDARTVSQ